MPLLGLCPSLRMNEPYLPSLPASLALVTLEYSRYFPPPGLCICSFSLEYSFPNICIAHSYTSFRPLHKHHLKNEASLTHYNTEYPNSSRSSPSLSHLLLTSFDTLSEQAYFNCLLSPARGRNSVEGRTFLHRVSGM